MSAFIVFSWDDYSANGGGNDYPVPCDTLEEAILVARSALERNHNSHVYDIVARKIIWDSNVEVGAEEARIAEEKAKEHRAKGRLYSCSTYISNKVNR